MFVSNTCSDAEFKVVQELKYKEKMNASQKYFSLLIDGICRDESCNVVNITARSIDPSNSKIRILKRKKESLEPNLSYFYSTIINVKIIKNIWNFISGFVYSLVLLNRNRTKKVLVVDPLVHDLALGAMLAARLIRNVKKIAILTDMPEYLEVINKSDKKSSKLRIRKRIRKKLSNLIINSADSYCFLVEAMNTINSSNKPCLILEGMVPATNCKNTTPSVFENKAIYAGGLFPQFGIENLVDAVKKIHDKSFKMVFYGEGTSIQYIQAASIEDPRIIYGGTLPLDCIVREERGARLLINPRPSSEIFTKYSFPSKTLEYMSTGRPVLTTRLSGIPDEYYDYLFTFDDETVEGMCKTIEMIIKKNDEELNCFGKKGMDFVMNNKTNIKQAKRFVDFCFAEQNEHLATGYQGKKG